MEQEFYRADDYAKELYNLWAYPSDQFTVVKSSYRNLNTGEMNKCAYVFYKNTYVASMPLNDFNYYFALSTKAQTTPENVSHKLMFHVTIEEVYENVYTVEASDGNAAIVLATKGRLGVRLSQALTDFTVVSAKQDTKQENCSDSN